MEAITYEKKLRMLAEKALKKFQEGPDTEHSDAELDTIMPQLICDFKDVISDMYPLLKHANRKEVLNSILDPQAECIWNPPLEGGEGQEAAPEVQVIWEEVAQQDLEDVMHGLDEMLSDDQVRLIEKLLHSHACTLEWQGQVLMLLGKLVTSISPKMYLTLLNATVKLMHQVMLPEAMKAQLTPPENPKKVKQMVAITDKVTPNPEYMKPWPEDSATLYLAATLHYIIRKLIVSSSNMKQTTKVFRVKLMELRHCINGHKYKGGSKK